jgi:SNF2 family DNA or RNA helicase
MKEDKFGLYDDCGVGKTFVMQSAAIVHKAHGYRSLVVMPPTLLIQFEETFKETFSGVEDYLQMYRLGPVKSKKGITAAQQRQQQVADWNKAGWPDVMLMSYQMFIKDFVQDSIVKHYQIFIIDEAHNLRNLGNKAGNFLYELTNMPNRESALILSTATPEYRDPRDAYCLIRLTSPGLYSSEKNFSKQHVIYEKKIIKLQRPIHGREYTTLYEVRGFMRMDLLRQNLYQHAARITKDKVLPKMTPTIIEERVELSDAHHKYYREFARARIAELPDGDIIAATNAQALRQELLRIITNIHEYTNKITVKGNEILSTCDTLIDGMGLGPENKIVLFANSRMSIRTLEKYYAKYNPALMYGDANSAKGLNQFLQDKTCLMMVANPNSAGAGLNLQSVCSTFIVVEPVTIPGLLKQASERFPRAGQKNPVIGYVLKPLATVASLMTDIMLEREGYILASSPDKESFLLEIEGR